MMDAGERALLEATVVEAITAADGADAIDRALEGLGWMEMLEAEPRDAVEIVFGALGATNATASVLDDGETLGAETSIDKVLVATAEQSLYDTARRVLGDRLAIDDSAAGEQWRREYLYSRAATIYGGTAEVQRNIIARRLLDLGADE